VSRLGWALAAGAAAGIAVHAGPALSTITPVRRRLLPALAGRGRPGHVALTFDDGPDPGSTPAFLRVLAEHDVKATFFLLGAMLDRDLDLGREIVAAGHEIGVHGWHHRCLLGRGAPAVRQDLARAQDLMRTIAGVTPRWYRPPYGVLTTGGLRVARELGLTPVLWTSWGRDWEAGATPASVQRTVTRRMAGGGTVLLHDSDCMSAPNSWRRTIAALPAILETARRRGLTVGPLAEHGMPARRPASPLVAQ
jgi:peptidoglycan/xylan/chitin deacetylase (PgdA/CDA1 family)